MTISGGTVHQGAGTFGTGTLYITSGAVALNVDVQENSSVSLEGGSVGRDVRGFQTGKVYMSGGIVQSQPGGLQHQYHHEDRRHGLRPDHRA